MRKLIASYTPYARLCFLLALAVVTGLLLWPNPPKITSFYYMDKLEHLLTFCMLTLLGLFAYPLRPVLMGLIVYGGATEVMQQVLTATRFASFADWAADIIGIMLAWALYQYWQKSHARI